MADLTIKTILHATNEVIELGEIVVPLGPAGLDFTAIVPLRACPRVASTCGACTYELLGSLKATGDAISTLYKHHHG